MDAIDSEFTVNEASFAYRVPGASLGRVCEVEIDISGGWLQEASF